MSIRSAASWAQPRQVSSGPRGARTGRAPRSGPAGVVDPLTSALTLRSHELPAHDREPLVGDRPGEVEGLPELRGRGAGRLRVRPDLGIGLDRAEAARGEVRADGVDQAPRKTGPSSV